MQPPQIIERLKICEQCEHLIPPDQNKKLHTGRLVRWVGKAGARLFHLSRCGKCGCFILLAAKTAWKNCPAGKWPVHIEIAHSMTDIPKTRPTREQPCTDCNKKIIRP